MSPYFYAYFDSYIIEPPQEYDYLQVWGHARGTYVSSASKESAFKFPIYRLLHQLVTSTIFHRDECDKVPFGDQF